MAKISFAFAVITTILVSGVVQIQGEDLETVREKYQPESLIMRQSIFNERNDMNGRIAGGVETIPNEFPWMALLNVSYGSGFQIYSGTLISNRWILTAAHIVDSKFIIGVSITLGAHDLSSTNRDHQLSYDLTSLAIHSHHDWDGVNTLKNDISLIQLPEDVPFSECNIQPIRLPYPDDPDQVGDPVVMTGWGQWAPETFSSVLRKVDTTVMSHNSCQQDAFNSLDSDATKVICCEWRGPRRFCYGDEGSPLLHYREEERQWFVIGVASYVVNCNAAMTTPNIYNRVRYYLDWIYKTTGLQPVTKKTSKTLTPTYSTAYFMCPTTNIEQNSSTPTTEKSISDFCANKSNGNYANPNECTSYISCSNGSVYKMNCPSGLVYNEKYDTCDYKNNVPDCI